MININCLPHQVKLQKIIDSCTFDEYGQPLERKENIDAPCFYDFPKHEILITQREKQIKVMAILFMLPTEKISIGDFILNVTDAGGTIIDANKMRVGAVRKAMDDKECHHLEIMLISA